MARSERAKLRSPDVPVIIPCYNQAHFLGGPLQSGRDQSHEATGTIVAEDGSTENTQAVVHRYSNALYLRQANQGAAPTRHPGSSLGGGDHLPVLDADDGLHPLGDRDWSAILAP